MVAVSPALRPAKQTRYVRAERRHRLQPLGLLVALLATLVCITILAAPILTENWYWPRIIAWRESTADDFATKFPSRAVPNAPPMSALEPASSEVPTAFAMIRYPAENGPAAAPIDVFMSQTGTRALLVLQGDALLVERYANGSSHEATQTSFSMAKSFVSTLIGAAIADGSIGSVDDPIVRYLPELAGYGVDGVTIRHLLAMDSGLRYSGVGSGGTPWQDDAKTYYDPDLRSLALTVRPAVPPGTRWEYNNYHPLLLGLILERATGRHVADYLSDKIWQPLGMEAPASWSLDSRHDAFEKMESGINARAVDFARFGRLMLNRGTWQGRQILPGAWIELATRANAPKLNPGYGLMWWLDTTRPGRFYAAGNLGQYIYVAPDRNMVVVRLGERYGGIDMQAWPTVLRDMADRAPKVV